MMINAENRYQAFAIHIFISAIIFIVLAAIITYFWYPDFLFATDGGWNGIRLIAGIDFIIGPTLTLIVYKVGKPGLKLDLYLIGLLQFFCLTFGTWTVYKERPLAVIYSNGEFRAISHNNFEIYDISLNLITSLDNKIPAWIYTNLPIEPKEREKLLMSQIGTKPVYVRSELYAPYIENLSQIIKEAIDPDTLELKIKEAISENGKMYNYYARYGSGYIEINKNTGEFIKIH